MNAPTWRELLTAYAGMGDASLRDLEDAAEGISNLVPSHEIPDFYREYNSVDLIYEQRYALNEAARNANLIPDEAGALDLFDLLLGLKNRLQMMKVVAIWIDGSSEIKAVVQKLVDNLPEGHRNKAMLEARLNPSR